MASAQADGEVREEEAGDEEAGVDEPGEEEEGDEEAGVDGVEEEEEGDEEMDVDGAEEEGGDASSSSGGDSTVEDRGPLPPTSQFGGGPTMPRRRGHPRTIKAKNSRTFRRIVRGSRAAELYARPWCDNVKLIEPGRFARDELSERSIAAVVIQSHGKMNPTKPPCEECASADDEHDRAFRWCISYYDYYRRSCANCYLARIGCSYTRTAEARGVRLGTYSGLESPTGSDEGDAGADGAGAEVEQGGEEAQEEEEEAEAEAEEEAEEEEAEAEEEAEEEEAEAEAEAEEEEAEAEAEAEEEEAEAEAEEAEAEAEAEAEEEEEEEAGSSAVPPPPQPRPKRKGTRLQREIAWLMSNQAEMRNAKST